MREAKVFKKIGYVHQPLNFVLGQIPYAFDFVSLVPSYTPFPVKQMLQSLIPISLCREEFLILSFGSTFQELVICVGTSCLVGGWFPEVSRVAGFQDYMLRGCHPSFEIWRQLALYSSSSFYSDSKRKNILATHFCLICLSCTLQRAPRLMFLLLIIFSPIFLVHIVYEPHGQSV